MNDWIHEPSTGLTFMLTDNASTIPKMMIRAVNINQAIVFLYSVLNGFIPTVGNLPIRISDLIQISDIEEPKT